jgi:hypothetical protein
MVMNEVQRTEIADICDADTWRTLLNEVEQTQQPRVLTRDGKDVLEVRPAKRTGQRRTRPKGQPITEDDPIWRLFGTGDSGIGDISENKHKYLADAYLGRRENS